MNSESRNKAVLVVLGALLLAVSLVLPRLGVEESPVNRLPTVATTGAAPSAPRAAAAGSAAPAGAPGAQSPPRLMRHPTLSRTQIAFDFAGELWVVPREGGDARRLVTGQLRNSRPIFSPDGASVAYG